MLHASGDVCEVWVVDPGIEGGGYWELSVTNTTGSDMFVLSVGNTGADVVFTDPALVGLWRPSRNTPAQWDAGLSFPFANPGWIKPDTSTLPFATHFAGYSQVLTYYVQTAGSELADGGTIVGFRFKGPGGSPYLLFDGAGNISAEGETNSGTTPARSGTWGQIKSLFE